MDNRRNLEQDLQAAVSAILRADRIVAFTGAGISAESGIPTFRGEDGLWSQYDPSILSIDYFFEHPHEAWVGIRELFYQHFQAAEPNAAHTFLAQLEQAGKLHRIITQNIDSLHHKAGSLAVIEYHGTSARLICPSCGQPSEPEFDRLDFPPLCAECGEVLKPDFVFFGEKIPERAQVESMWETRKADLWLIIGTTGEVVPASLLPWEAKSNGAFIVEINTRPSAYTDRVSDIFLQGTAVEISRRLAEMLLNGSPESGGAAV